MAVFHGYHVDIEKFSAVLDGVLDRAPMELCAGMISGYLGDAALAEPILQALDNVESLNQDLVFLLDPVIGDDGAGVLRASGGPGSDCREAAAARIDHHAQPFRARLSQWSRGRAISIRRGSLPSCLLKRGPQLVVATGLPCPGASNDLAMLAVARDQRWLIRTPKLQRAFSGCGDAFSALFLGHYLLAPDLKSAFERAASAVFSLLDVTQQSGGEELSLVAAQDLFADPRHPVFRSTTLEHFH